MKIKRITPARVAGKQSMLQQSSPSKPDSDALVRDTFDTPADVASPGGRAGPWWSAGYAKAMPPLLGSAAIAVFGDAADGIERFASMSIHIAVQTVQEGGTVTVLSGQSLSLEVLNHPSTLAGWQPKMPAGSQPSVHKFGFTKDRPNREGPQLTGTARQLVRYTWRPEQVAALGNAFTLSLHSTHPRFPATRLLHIVVKGP